MLVGLRQVSAEQLWGALSSWAKNSEDKGEGKSEEPTSLKTSDAVPSKSGLAVL